MKRALLAAVVFAAFMLLWASSSERPAFALFLLASAPAVAAVLWLLSAAFRREGSVNAGLAAEFEDWAREEPLDAEVSS